MPSLSVFKIKSFNKKELIKSSITNLVQTSLNDIPEFEQLASPTSTLKLMHYDEKNDIGFYNAVHYSDTIKHPIRVCIDDVMDGHVSDNTVKHIKQTQTVKSGYQMLFNFDVIINFGDCEIFVFTKKDAALHFMRRFRGSEKLDFEIIEFDLSKIEEVKGLENIWGLWEDSRGKCTKKAYFGTEVHKEDGVDKKMITSYNVEYTYDGDPVDLIICRECRLSSKSAIVTNAALKEIYIALKEGLKKEIIQISQLPA